MRGYVIEREDCEECGDSGTACVKCEVLERMVRELAAKWNTANSREEQRRWSVSREQREDEEAHWSEVFDEEAAFAIDNALGREEAERLFDNDREEWKRQHKAHFDRLWAAHREKENKHVREMEAAEELLSRLGARMMRRFEHMNEEESYHEMMESRAEARASASGEWDY